MKGWGWPHSSSYAHYYIDHQSICMTSAFFSDDLEDFDHDSPDNCWVCQRKLYESRKHIRKKRREKRQRRAARQKEQLQTLRASLFEHMQHKGANNEINFNDQRNSADDNSVELCGE